VTWFKVDDKLHDHRKARAAKKAAMGVWVLAGSWAADNLTDGFVPESVLSRWGTKADAARLVEVGLWHIDAQDGEDGWRFHEWEGRQPTRSEVLTKREVRAEAGRAGGFASGRSRREAKPKQVASPTVEPPSRPVPSRPEPTTPNGVVPAADTRLPGSWEPNSDHQSRALRCGLDLEREAEKFRAHADENERRAKNWNAAFTRWLIQASEYAIRDRTRPSTTSRTRVDEHLAVARQIAQRDGIDQPAPQITNGEGR
jgi:hypothetical protein